MAKVKITKSKETISGPIKGPGDRILNDDQIEQWSQFAQKNQNLNFDQKWDEFSKINPKFGASKEDVKNALFKQNRLMTEMENKRIERSFESAPRSGPLGNIITGTLNTGDVFLPLYQDGKLVGRYNENMGMSTLYKPQPNQESARIAKMLLPASKIPPASSVDLKSGIYDVGSGIVRYLTSEGNEFAADINDLQKMPGYSESLEKQFSEQIRARQQAPGGVRQIIEKQGKPSIFNK